MIRYTCIVLAGGIVVLLLNLTLARPAERINGAREEKLKRLFVWLDSFHNGKKTEHSKHPHPKKAFHLPDKCFWGGDEWRSYEHDHSNGHGKDIIENDNLNLDSKAIRLIASFDVNINGKSMTPDVDKKDMRVQQAQNHDIHPHVNSNRRGIVRRNFAKRTRLWEEGIVPYEINYKTIKEPGKHKIIKEAIDDINSLTCLRIVPRDEAPPTVHTSYIQFTNAVNLCYSYVGRALRLLQPVNLGNSCYDKSTVIHELMHAIGMQHEHQRSDRDKYIDMVWDNIANGTKNENMYLVKTDNKHSFDAESILQYGLYAFSKNGKKSMNMKDKRLEYLPNSAEGLTFYDVQDITLGYDCTKNCTATTSPLCENDGFIGYTCECMCPSGLKGEICTEIDSDKDCGEYIVLNDGDEKTIQSPNYSNNEYPLDKNCVWFIKGPENSNIELTINDLSLRVSDFFVRCFHWLEVRFNLMGQTGKKLCGNISDEVWVTSNAAINSVGNMMMLKFDSRFSKDIESLGKGFRATVRTKYNAKPCDAKPCKNGGSCTNIEDYFTCSCLSGWKGSTCEEMEEKPCDTSPCKNGGSCMNSGESFICICRSGWKGTTCEESYINPCDSSPCKNEGLCLDNGDSFSCDCSFDWKGETCEEKDVKPCDGTPCKNGGLCTNNGDSFTCNCPSGWKGLMCEEIDVKPCDAAPCKNGGSCMNNADSFICNCLSEWKGSTCEENNAKPCDSTPCKNGGSCTNNGDTFTCSCPSGWKGPTCEESDVKPCDTTPCKNGGSCTNHGDSFTCHCPSGWQGSMCTVMCTRKCSFEPNDPCFLKSDSSAVKASSVASPTPAFSGTHFVSPTFGNNYVSLYLNTTAACIEKDMQYCMKFSYFIQGNSDLAVYLENDTSFSNPLQEWKVKGIWSNAQFSFIANPGYNPFIDIYYLDVDAEFAAIDDVILENGKCVELSPCSNNPCKNGGSCSESGGTFKCQCAGSWKGTTCEEKNAKPCDSTPCKNAGSCANNGNTFTCNCPAGWKGPTCEESDVKPCDTSPCKNGGSCTNHGDSFTCNCPFGWQGSTCAVMCTRKCSFEPNASCFLKNDFSPVKASSVASPTTAFSGTFFVSPTFESNYVSLHLNATAACVVKDMQYCIKFSYFIQGNTDLAIYLENDTSFSNPIQEWKVKDTWSNAQFSFIANSGYNPVIDIYYSDIDAEFAAIDDVILENGNCKESSPCIGDPCKNGGSCSVSGEKFKCQCAGTWTGTTCEESTSVQICTFEPNAPCFLESGYETEKVRYFVMPSTAVSGENYVTPPFSLGYETLEISSTKANVKNGHQYCLQFHYYIGGNGIQISIFSDYSYDIPIKSWTDDTNNAWKIGSYSFIADYDAGLPLLDLDKRKDISGSVGVDDVKLFDGTCPS